MRATFFDDPGVVAIDAAVPKPPPKLLGARGHTIVEFY